MLVESWVCSPAEVISSILEPATWKMMVHNELETAQIRFHKEAERLLELLAGRRRLVENNQEQLLQCENVQLKSILAAVIKPSSSCDDSRHSASELRRSDFREDLTPRGEIVVGSSTALGTCQSISALTAGDGLPTGCVEIQMTMNNSEGHLVRAFLPHQIALDFAPQLMRVADEEKRKSSPPSELSAKQSAAIRAA